MIQCRIDFDWYRHISGISDRSDALPKILAASLGGNVCGRVMQPEVGREPSFTAFGNNLAMAVLGKFIGHHPVVTRNILEAHNGQLAQPEVGCRVLESLNHGLCQHSGLAMKRGSFNCLDVDADKGTRWESPHRQPPTFPPIQQVHRLEPAFCRNVRQQASRRLFSDQFGKRRAQHMGDLGVHDLVEIRTGVGHASGPTSHRQQRAVRLDGPWRVDRFALA